MRMRVEFNWEPESLRWLETMPDRMTAAMRGGVKHGVTTALQRARVQAGLDMPRFEGWAGDDLRALPGAWAVGNDLFKAFLTFVGPRTMVSEVDTVSAPAPFSYPRAKHTPGAEPHRVWLYSASGAVTEHRKKLIRWLKLHGTGANWSLLPDAPTKELWNKHHKDGFPPPFVDVNPRATATPYFDDLIRDGGDPLATWVVDGFWPQVKRAWEAV